MLDTFDFVDKGLLCKNNTASITVMFAVQCCMLYVQIWNNKNIDTSVVLFEFDNSIGVVSKSVLSRNCPEFVFCKQNRIANTFALLPFLTYNEAKM